MKFIPNIPGKNSQAHTYDAVRDHTLNEIQKSYRQGEDIADNLRLGVDKGIKDQKPVRKRAVKPELTEEQKQDQNKMREVAEEMKIDQEGLDIEYQIDLKEFREKENNYKSINLERRFT